MPKLELSSEELQKILNDYEDGMSLADVGQKYHHNANTLKKYFLEHNIYVRSRVEGLRASKKKQESDNKKRIYYVNDSFFSNQNSDMAYLLGFIMADGNVSKRDNRLQIVLQEQDKDFLESIYQKIGGSPVTSYLVKNKYPTVRWQCMSGQIKKDLAEYGIVPNKTGLAEIPKKLDKIFYPDFIRGYFDGDGSIYEDNSIGLSFVSHNIEILQDILNFFEKNNIPKVSIYTDYRGNINYYIRYRSQAALKIYDIFYYNSSCWCLPRKFKKFTDIIQKRKNSTRLCT